MTTPTTSFIGSKLSAFTQSNLRARGAQHVAHAGGNSILLAYAISKFLPQPEWAQGHGWTQRPGFATDPRTVGPINYPPFPNFRQFPTDRNEYYQSGSQGELVNIGNSISPYRLPYYQNQQDNPGGLQYNEYTTYKYRQFGTQSGAYSTYGYSGPAFDNFGNPNFGAFDPTYTYDTDSVRMKVWIYSFPSSLLFRTDALIYTYQIPYTSTPWEYGPVSGFDKKLFTPVEGDFTITCKSLLQTNTQANGIVTIPHHFSNGGFAYEATRIPYQDYYGFLGLAMDYFTDTKNNLTYNSMSSFDFLKPRTQFWESENYLGMTGDDSKHANWIFDKDWDMNTTDELAAPLSPNSFKVTARSFSHSEEVDGWGWEGDVNTATLDDTAYSDCYGTFIDTVPDPTRQLSFGMMSYRDFAECNKPEAEFLGFDIEFEDKDGNQTPGYTVEEKTLKATATRILANKIYVYQNVMVFRCASSYIFGVCTNPAANSTDSFAIASYPYYALQWFGNAAHMDVDAYINWDPSNISIPPVSGTVPGATGFAGNMCGISGYYQFPFTYTIIFPDWLPWKTVSAIYAEEFKEIPCSFVQTKVNQYQNVYVSSDPYQSGNIGAPCITQAWSTRADHTYIAYQNSCANSAFGGGSAVSFIGSCQMSGPVDTMEEMLMWDSPAGPNTGFYQTVEGDFGQITDHPASWNFTSCYHRWLSGWCLTKTPEEMYAIADGVGDSLAMIKGLAQAQLAACISFVTDNANSYYVGNIDAPHNAPWVLSPEDVNLTFNIFAIYAGQGAWHCPQDFYQGYTALDNPAWLGYDGAYHYAPVDIIPP